MTTIDTREEWLVAAAERLTDMIAERTELKPSPAILVSCGWPRRDRGGQVIGQCYNRASSIGADKHQVFISPTLPSAAAVLPVLLHELIHAADDCESGHKGAFRRAWKALGFTGKPTCSVPGKELKAELRALAGELGPYPHTRLDPAKMDKPQTTRMLKVECPDCGCIVRMTRKWLDNSGTPQCGCGSPMEVV